MEVDGEDSGIKTGHAYGLNRVIEFPDDQMENPRKTHRLILIRNPWGQAESMLKWGTNTEQLEKHNEALQRIISEMEEDEQFDLNAEDGLFFMNFQLFRQVYDKIFIA